MYFQQTKTTHKYNTIIGSLGNQKRGTPHCPFQAPPKKRYPSKGSAGFGADSSPLVDRVRRSALDRVACSRSSSARLAEPRAAKARAQGFSISARSRTCKESRAAVGLGWGGLGGGFRGLGWGWPSTKVGPSRYGPNNGTYGFPTSTQNFLDDIRWVRLAVPEFRPIRLDGIFVLARFPMRVAFLKKMLQVRFLRAEQGKASKCRVGDLSEASAILTLFPAPSKRDANTKWKIPTFWCPTGAVSVPADLGRWFKGKLTISSTSREAGQSTITGVFQPQRDNG